MQRRYSLRDQLRFTVEDPDKEFRYQFDHRPEQDGVSAACQRKELNRLAHLPVSLLPVVEAHDGRRAVSQSLNYQGRDISH